MAARSPLLVRSPALYAEPKGDQPPPWWIRGILIATCTGVSFAHGSNDGQKGMGLIMLILIGTVPTAYALNRALPESQVAQFQKTSDAASKVVAAKASDEILGVHIIGPMASELIAEAVVARGEAAGMVERVAAFVGPDRMLDRLPCSCAPSGARACRAAIGRPRPGKR